MRAGEHQVQASVDPTGVPRILEKLKRVLSRGLDFAMAIVVPHAIAGHGEQPRFRMRRNSALWPGLECAQQGDGKRIFGLSETSAPGHE